MPASLGSFSVSTIVPFVRNRYDFLNWGFQTTGESVFQFRLLNVRRILSTQLCYPHVASTETMCGRLR